jgi:hypothetical protein
MKARIFSIVVLSLSLMIGCGKSEEKKEGSASVENYEVIDSKGEVVKLRYTFEKGDKFRYKLTTTSTAEEKIVADTTINSKSDQVITYIFETEVLDVDQDKIAELSVNVASVVLNANLNGQKVSYDSKSENNLETKQKFLEYETIVNMPYRIRLTDKGELIEVSRLEKMIDKMNSLQPQKQNLTTEQKTQFSKQLGESAIKPLTQLLFRELPEKSVGKDSIWERRYPGQLSIFQLENRAQFKLLNFVKADDEKAVNIEAGLSVTWKGNKSGEENGVKYNFADPKISGSGKVIFNVEKGNLVRSETSTRVEITVDIEAKDALNRTQKTKRTEISTNKNVVESI